MSDIILNLLTLPFCFIAIWGCIKKIKISKKIKKYDNTEMVSKEISDELKVATILIIGGFTMLIVIRIIGVVIALNSFKTY